MIITGPPLDIPDVPDTSAEWYRRIVGTAADLPPLVQVVAEIATDAVLVMYVAAFALLWWRARTREPALAARALAAPVVVVLAFALSEYVKDAMRVDRPCRLVAAAPPIAPCPEPGDWSFPSNHSTVAGAVAVAVLWSAVRLGLIMLVVTGLAAASRVVVGVHFPHDVLVGFLLGAAVAAALPTIARMGEKTVRRLRVRPAGRWLIGAGVPAADTPTRPLRVAPVVKLRTTLGILGVLPVLWVGFTAHPERLGPVEVAAHVVALTVAVLLTERLPALALGIAIAAWEVVFLGRVEADSLLAATVLAAGLAAVGLLAGRSPASDHRDAGVLVLGPAAGAVAALLTSGEADTAIGAAVGAAVLSTVPWTLGRYRRQREAMERAGWDRAARWEREAEYARARERARLAGEMHDLVGHELAKAALQIGALEVDPGLDERHRHAAGGARAGVTAAAERLADTVRLLRADGGDPGRSVAELVQESSAVGLDVTLDADELRPHDPVVAATLSRVVAEALTNAMKHAPGADVHVAVCDGDRGPRVMIRSGAPRSPALAAPGARLGLAGLGERVRLLGGTFTAGSEPDGRFRVAADLPRSPTAPTAPSPTGTDVERRRAEDRFRRSGRRTVLAAALVSLAGVGAVLAYMWYDAATSVLTATDAAVIGVGDPIAAVAPLLPARTRTDDPSGVPAEPNGATCSYYSTHSNPFDEHGDDLHRVCVRGDRVVAVELIVRGAAPESL